MKQLAPFPLIMPGTLGLNTQAKGMLLGPEWATKLENTVVDASGRVAARKGYQPRTTTPFGDPTPFVNGIEYRRRDGDTHLVLSTDDKVAASTDGGVTFSDVTGTASFTSGNWYFVNFNDHAVGFQEDEAPLIYDGVSCSQVSDPDAPTGGIGTAAFGRVWAVDADGVTIRYSALLDPTDWSGTGSGLIDMTNVWPDNDVVMAIAAYNNVLVVFGSRNIVVFADDMGSEIGMDPNNMVVVDTIPGIGCLSQHSVQLVSGDIWFVSNTRDLMSLQRVVMEQKSGHVSSLSRNISDLLRDSIDSGSFVLDNMRSVFSPKERLYLLSLPTGASGGKVFAFDTRGLLEDGSARVVGVWNQLVPSAFIPRVNGELLMAWSEDPGAVGAYAQRRDNGQAYRVVYESGWLNIIDHSPQLAGRTLILKRMNSRLMLDLQTTVTLKWAFDFDTRFTSQQLTLSVGTGAAAEWGESEWGIAEWGGGVSLNNQRVHGRGTGSYIKIGVEASVDGGEFSIAQLELWAKVGRLRG